MTVCLELYLALGGIPPSPHLADFRNSKMDSDNGQITVMIEKEIIQKLKELKKALYDLYTSIPLLLLALFSLVCAFMAFMNFIMVVGLHWFNHHL